MTSPYRSSTAPSHDLNRPAHSSNAAFSGSTSALRPRNRRLLSTELTSPGPGAKGSRENRAVSPIPSRHPSRIADSQRAASRVAQPVGGLVRSSRDTASGALSPTAGFGKGLWEGGWTGSWSALQGLASSVLGTDVVENSSDGEGAGMGRKGGDMGRTRTRGNSAAKKAPATWGPSGVLRSRGESAGGRTLEDRDLAVKARKTASILESHEGANGGLDVNGNYKRRTSLERPSTLGQKAEEQDALVYVHHVQPSDTLAGVVLKYNCQPAVFRKANGLYPNDMIQVRETVFLPVDACAIKGMPCDPPSENETIDLLAPTPEMEDPPNSGKSYTNGGAWGHKSLDTGNGTSPLFNAYNTEQTNTEEKEDEEKSWVHVCWVLLDSSPSAKPVEIARLPRKTLGYFPPRRRKSHANSSSISTPRGSFDTHNILHLSEEASENSIDTSPGQGSNVGSPSQGSSYFPVSTSNPISRRVSSSNSSAPPKWMCGPGGVGSFDVHSPGPAQDSLNRWASKHVPILGIGYLPSSSATGGEMLSYGFNDELASIAEMPRSYSTAAGSDTTMPSEGGQSIGMGLEHAAAAIEGWVRKFAIKATPGTPKIGMGNKATPELGEGDLIELLGGAGSDDGRAFEPPGTDSLWPAALGEGSGRDGHAGMVRGRTHGPTRAKGKSD
jgi:LysM repeat protein